MTSGVVYAWSHGDRRQVRRNPPPPFITSTLQQEASRKLGFSPRHTMQLAQRLYEGVDLEGESEGLITYMRTDGVQIAPEAIAAARRTVEQLYGRHYVPPSPRQYETKAKNAQEAHEAIRPTDFTKAPEKVARYLDVDALRLYKLVWQRTLASQASSAEIERTTAEIGVTGNDGVDYGLRATGSVIRFDGFLKLYASLRDLALQALDGLQPPSMGARVSFAGGKPKVTDGPFAESKEAVGGFWIIDVKSREEAIEWAKRIPASEIEVVEVRPFLEISDFPADVRAALEEMEREASRPGA